MKCSDGAVVGADGAATSGMGIIQPGSKKLRVFDDRLLIGVAGHVGVGQRIIGEVHAAFSLSGSSNKILERKPHEAMKGLSDAIRRPISDEHQYAASVPQQFAPDQFAYGTNTVIALPLSKTSAAPSLFAFDNHGMSFELTEAAPTVSIGTGQPIAEPFLAFLRHALLGNAAPSVVQGVFLVLWTIDQAIRTQVFGLSQPVQIVAIERRKNGRDGKWRTRELSDADFLEHRQFISTLEASLRDDFLAGGRIEPAATTPEPPPPPTPPPTASPAAAPVTNAPEAAA